MNRIIFLSTIFIGLTGCGGSGSEADKIVPVPIASTLNLATSEDESVTGTLAGQSTSGGTLSYKLVSDPSNGDATLNGSQVEYIPNENYFGEDSFTFTVSENGKTSTPAKVNVTVTSVNDAPETSQKEFEIEEDKALVESFDIYDPDNDSWQITLVEPPKLGNITINSDGTFEYIPNENIFGIEHLSYSVSDGELESQISSININIQSINDAPVVPEEINIDIKSGVLALVKLDATDVESSDLVYSIGSKPKQSEIFEQVDASSSLSLKYKYGFIGKDEFSYSVSDNELTSNVGKGNINVSVATSTHESRYQTYSNVWEIDENVYTSSNDGKFIYSASALTQFIPNGLDESKISGKCNHPCSFIMSLNNKGTPENLHFVSMPASYAKPIAMGNVLGNTWMISTDRLSNILLNEVTKSGDSSTVSSKNLIFPGSGVFPSSVIFDDGSIIILNDSKEENFLLFSKDKLKLAKHIGGTDEDTIKYWYIKAKYAFDESYRLIGHASSGEKYFGTFVVDVQKDGSSVNFKKIENPYGETNGFHDAAFLSNGDVALVFDKTLAVWDKELNEVWVQDAASYSYSKVRVGSRDQIYWLHTDINYYTFSTYSKSGELINSNISNVVTDNINNWLFMVDDYGNSYIAYSHQNYPEKRVIYVDYVDFSGQKQWTKVIESEEGYFRHITNDSQMIAIESEDKTTAYLLLALSLTPEAGGGCLNDMKGALTLITIDRGISTNP